MSSTRRASKRDRLARRAENDQIRTARRDSLAVLLSRAQRSVPLTADEAALLRAAVEAEVREGDAARQAERGQQRAADRERERVAAAEAAIVEAEERAVAEERAERAAKRTAGYRRRAEEAEQRLARIRDMADAWTRRLPDVIRTATAAEAVRNAVDGDDRPVMFAMTTEQATPEVITDRAAIRAALDEPEPRQPSTTAERCPSCEHGPEYHTDPAGCWFTVAKGKPDRDAVCGCAVVRVTPEGAPR